MSSAGFWCEVTDLLSCFIPPPEHGHVTELSLAAGGPTVPV